MATFFKVTSLLIEIEESFPEGPVTQNAHTREVVGGFYGDCARSRGRVLATSPTASAHVRANDVGLSLSLAASQPSGDQTSGPRPKSQLRAGIGCGRNAPSAPPEAGAPRGALVRGGFKCARGIVNVGTWVERFNARITSRPADGSTQGQSHLSPRPTLACNSAICRVGRSNA